MSGLVAARAALVTAVSASEKEASGTACYVASSGTDWTGLGRTGVQWNFRVICAVGFGGDFGTGEAALATLVAAKLATLNALAGWQVNGVGPSTSRTISGGEHLAADIAVTTKVDI